MIVFCPNCGTQNPGLPGARATCASCGSTFEVPGGGAGNRPSATAVKPTLQAPPPAGFAGAGLTTRAGRTVNPLAITSLVAGILCCFPLVSPLVAIGCGVSASRQIDASPETQSGKGLAVAGVVLGALTALGQLSSFLAWILGANG